MLVLTRKKGESLMIGDHIELKIVAVEGETVKVGIEAPKSVEIYRREVYDNIRVSNRAAAMDQVTPELLKKFMDLGNKS